MIIMSPKNNTPNPTEFWDKNHGTIYSNIGGALISKGIVYSHGYSILDDLVGDASYIQVLALNVTGRMPERRLADWMEAAYICLSWPEPRIWCNQVGALGGTLRTSHVAGTAAGILAADSTMYGTLPLIDGVNFIQEALRKKQNGMNVEEIINEQCKRFHGRPNITGYARPIARGDERVIALERVTKLLGYEIGDHLTLAHDISDFLYTKFSETININGYVSAFLSDQGYTANEIYQLASISVSAGVLACHIDTSNQPPESFLPLQCEDIDYHGKHFRPVPERE